MNKALVIVDVQREFDEYIQHDLVDALSEYAEKFDVVYQIWDTHHNTVAPTHSFPGQVDSIPKKFGKKHFSDEVKEYIEKIKKSSSNGRTFKLSDDEGYIVRVKNNHGWFYVNPEIVELISKLKDKKVILAGGADGECLEDVYQAFLAFGLKVHINKKYTYSAKTSQEDSVEEKILIPDFSEKLNELRNNKEDAEEIVVHINDRIEREKLESVVSMIDNGYNARIAESYPCVLYFNFRHKVSYWGGANSTNYDQVTNGEFDDGLYKKLYTIDDIEIIKKILKEGKIIEEKIPNYMRTSVERKQRFMREGVEIKKKRFLY